MSRDPEPRLFGTVERRLFRVTGVLFVSIVLALLIGVVVWILGQTLSYFFNLILPLAVAGILALILYPVVAHLERWTALPHVVTTSIIMLLFIGIISAAMLFLVPTLFREAIHFIDVVPTIVKGWESRYPELTRMIVARAEDGTLASLTPDAEDTTRTLRSYGSALVSLGFVPLLLFFMLLSGDRLRDQAGEILSVFNAPTQQQVMYFVDVFVRQVTGFFQGQLVIAMVMGAMLATGFTIAGLKGGILVGLTLGLLNIVPFLGTLVGLLVVLPLAYLQPEGGLQLLGLSLLVFVVVQLVESWFLTPRIMANRSGLHPALVVISVIFWGIALGGIIGMILAVPLTAFIIAVWHQTKLGLSRSLQSDD